MELSEIIKNVKQPEINEEMIKMFIAGIETPDFYTYIQQQNQLKDTSEINRDEEKELHKKIPVGFNQKNQFLHMGTLRDIDYCFSRLYVNCDKQDLMDLASAFTEKCKDKEIPIYFKYSSDHSKRADQFVIYSNLANLTDYVEILQSIATENPDIVKRCGKPPILTGTLDEWIGIGDEPSTGASSYTQERAEIIEDAIRQCVPVKDDFEESYDYSKIDYDLIKQTIQEGLKRKGLSIENFSFNNANIALYNADKETREQYDLSRKQEVMQRRKELADKKQIIRGQIQEKNAYKKLQILEQIGLLPEELQEGYNAYKSRYGFLKDMIPQENTIEQLLGKYDLSFPKYLISDKGTLKTHLPNKGLVELTDEQKKELSEQILPDITEYYKNYFEKEKSIISDTISRYNQLAEETKNNADSEKREEKANLYSKIKFLSNGEKFFGSFGISQEEIDTISSQASDCLENTTEKLSKEESERKAHESSLDVLTAVLMNTGIKDIEELKQYYKDNHLEWEKDYQISDDELEQIANEISSEYASQDERKEFTEQEIGKGTVKIPTNKKDEALDRQNIDQHQLEQIQEEQQEEYQE